LPSRTFEDRVLFVLNRIDECASMIDLLRVYGTLCWNLSQITGRKDIPMIHLSYSLKKSREISKDQEMSYLRYLENQRDVLKLAVLQAPRYRLDNLAAFVETHGERLAHFLEALISYRKRARKFGFKNFLVAFLCCLALGGAVFMITMTAPPLAGTDLIIKSVIAGGAVIAGLLAWALSLRRFFYKRFLKKALKNTSSLTALFNQTRKDNWEVVREAVIRYLRNTEGKFSLRDVRNDFSVVWQVYERGSKEIREALKELEGLSIEEETEFFKARLNLDDQGNPRGVTA